MLVERSNDSKFQAKFEIDVNGGFRYAINNLVGTWVKGTAVDDPIIFDPAQDPIGDLEGIPADELGSRSRCVNAETQKRLSTQVSPHSLSLATRLAICDILPTWLVHALIG